MSDYFRRIVLCLGVSLIGVLPLRAQGTLYRGTQSLFMETGVGARAQALGRAFTGLANDGSAVFWNPAGLDFLQQPNFVAYHSTLVEGTFFNFAAVTYPFLEFGSVGVGMARIGVNGIPLNNEWTNLAQGEYSEQEYYIAYGKRLPFWNLSLGTTFKMVNVNASELNANDAPVSKSGFSSGLDIALMWKPDFENAIVRNMSFGFNYQNVVAPSVKLSTFSYNDPRNLRFGIAKEIYFGGDQLKRLTILADVSKGSRSGIEYMAGMEYSFNRFLIARGGFDAGRMTVGMGTEFTQFQRFQVDYSVNLGSQYGTALHRLSLTMNFGKTIEERQNIARALRADQDQKMIAQNQEAVKIRAIKEHSTLGAEYLKDGKLIPALVELEQVVSLDPNNANAKSLLDTVRFRMDKQLSDRLADTATSVREMTVSQQQNKFVEDHYRKGYQLVQKGDYIAALSEFQTALERSPNNPDIQRSLNETRGLLDKRIASIIAKARSNAAGNNFSEALKLLSEARSLDPTNQQIQREIDTELKRISNRLSFLESTRSGLDAYQKGDYQAAMEAFEAALLVDPQNPTVKEYHKKSIVRAFATFKNLEGDVEKTYLQGVDLYVEGKYEQAIAIWQRILEKDPLNKRVLKAIDKAEDQIRQRDEAKGRKK